MGFDVCNLGDDPPDLSVNFWNWRPTVELIRSFGIIDDERLELMHIQCCGAEVTEDEARTIGERIKAEILPQLAENDRLLLDLTITDKPDDMKMYYGEDVHKNYSAQREWLTRFAEFCMSCSGFRVL